MENYRDIKLEKKDYNVIRELEQRLDQQFFHHDFIEDPDGYTATRFFSKNGKVAHLSIEDSKLDSSRTSYRNPERNI